MPTRRWIAERGVGQQAAGIARGRRGQRPGADQPQLLALRAREPRRRSTAAQSWSAAGERHRRCPRARRPARRRARIATSAAARGEQRAERAGKRGAVERGGRRRAARGRPRAPSASRRTSADRSAEVNAAARAGDEQPAAPHAASRAAAVRQRVRVGDELHDDQLRAGAPPSGSAIRSSASSGARGRAATRIDARRGRRRAAAAASVQRRVVAQDPPLEVLQRRRRLDAERRRRSARAQRRGTLEGLGLPARSGTARASAGREALAQRVLGDQGVQLADQLGACGRAPGRRRCAPRSRPAAAPPAGRSAGCANGSKARSARARRATARARRAAAPARGGVVTRQPARPPR